MNKQRLIATLSMVSALVRDNTTRGGSSNIGYHLPEIAEEDRIRVNTPKIRKHTTKRRINKLHDKKLKKSY